MMKTTPASEVNETVDIAWTIARRVSCESITSIQYVPLLYENPWDPEKTAAIHEVSNAVRILLTQGLVLAFHWEIDDVNESLTIDLVDPADCPDEGTVSRPGFDVTSRTRWNSYQGHTITSLIPLWHDPNEGAEVTPIAWELTFSAGRQLVIALGELVDQRPSYIPDTQLVFFDSLEAATYLDSLISTL